jgi:hypothetical protein
LRWLDLCLVGSLLALALPTSAAPVSMAWDYEGKGYTHFQVYRCTATTVNEDCVPLLAHALGSELPITQTTTTDTTGEDGQRYCYTVRATLAGAQPSVPSNPICKTLEAVVSGGPTNLREVGAPTTRTGPAQKQ